MIAPMKKFAIVLLDSDAEKAPQDLRKLGIAHVERFESSGASCADLERSLKRAVEAKSVLSSLPKRKDSGRTVMPQSDAGQTVLQILDIQAEVEAALQSAADARKDAERLKPWGEFDPALISVLSAADIRLKLFECPQKSLTAIPQETEFIKLSGAKGQVRIAVLGDTAVPQDCIEFRLPERSLSASLEYATEAERRAADKRASLWDYLPSAAAIDEEIGRLESELSVERIKAGMPAEDRLRYFKGFVPATQAPVLAREAAARGWALVLDDPGDEDMPPTKIENPPAVRIIQPVFDFLGTVPNYREYDISSWFLMFFSLYFAMIFGDGGYGLLMLAVTALSSAKALFAKKKLPDFAKLMFLLSGMTILWGLVTGSWFALAWDALPGFLRSLTIPAIASVNPDSGTNIKIFCFIVGALQLSIAHLKNIRRDFPNPKFLAQVGSLAMVIGMFNAVLNLVIDSARFPLATWALACISVGFVLVFAFGNWNGNLISSLIEGLKGIIPTFLGTVSVFADIVSYIRLWAVSLAGVAISQTVNGFAAALFGGAGGRLAAFIIGGLMGVVLLVAGHALNLAMSALSVVVHGVRLNMLEFSSHLGMEWSGYKYDPLRERAVRGIEEEKTL